MAHGLIWLWVLLGVLALAAALASMSIARSRRISKVRIQIKDSSGKNRTYWLGGGTRVSLGGKETPGVAGPLFPLEPFAGPVAHLRHSASGYSLLLEKGIEGEAAGRKLGSPAPVSPNTRIRLADSEGKEATFEFQDISTRTRTTASRIATPGQASGASAVEQLDKQLKA